MEDNVSIVQLGKSLKCEKDDEFGTILHLEIKETDVEIFFECPVCHKKWRNMYKFGHFFKMANMGLIDKPAIIEFQKKMVVYKGAYIKMENGLEGAFYVENGTKPLLHSEGIKLICPTCHQFYSLSFDRLKKKKILLLGYCPRCSPKKPKKIVTTLRAVLALGKAGVIEPELISKIREEATGGGFNVDESYTGQDGTLAYHVQERLGMVGDTKRTRCYICGAPLPEDATRCPKCGSDVDGDY